jgi:hypothetical protein
MSSKKYQQNRRNWSHINSIVVRTYFEKRIWYTLCVWSVLMVHNLSEMTQGNLSTKWISLTCVYKRNVAENTHGGWTMGTIDRKVNKEADRRTTHNRRKGYIAQWKGSKQGWPCVLKDEKTVPSCFFMHGQTYPIRSKKNNNTIF